jgi:hypothetical protein
MMCAPVQVFRPLSSVLTCTHCLFPVTSTPPAQVPPAPPDPLSSSSWAWLWVDPATLPLLPQGCHWGEACSWVGALRGQYLPTTVPLVGVHQLYRASHWVVDQGQGHQGVSLHPSCQG